MTYNLDLPVKDSQIKDLETGDIVYLNGIIITARDQAHKRIIDLINKNQSLPDKFSLIKGCAIYHCGPIIRTLEAKYEVISAGPTTSQRMDNYENQVVRKLDIKCIIGKGGMKSLDTKANTVVYLSYTGGCGAIFNKKVQEILHVEWKDLGLCEAVWFLKVKDLGPLIVAQDTHGNNLYNVQT